MFKVYVGNLDSRVTADVLRPLFEPFGDLDEIIVAVDPKTNRSRGFAIVLFRDPLKGQLAIETLTGRRINGRTVVINEALKRGKAPPGAAAPGARRGPFGPRFGATGRAGASGGRRFSSRNPRRGGSGPGGAGAPGVPGSPGIAGAPGSTGTGGSTGAPGAVPAPPTRPAPGAPGHGPAGGPGGFGRSVPPNGPSADPSRASGPRP